MAISARSLARGHGLYNLVGGVWPLVHRRSFELVLGPKQDYWLVNTVGGLMIVNGIVQLQAGGERGAVTLARRLGIGTSAVLLAIDLRYAPTGRIRATYLLDAVLEAAWIALWATSTDQA